MTCPAISPPTRSAISKASSRACSASRAAAAARRSAGERRAGRSGCHSLQGAGSHGGAAGGKLVDQEKWKRDEHPFDAYPRLVKQAENNEPPKPQDNFRWRYHGLFYVAPTQASYMCRLRIPNGILKHWQFAGVADLADNFGGPYAHVTTRANLQIREIEPKTPRH